MRTNRLELTAAVLAVATVTLAGAAHAQSGGSAPPGAGPGTSGGSTTSSSVQFYPGGVAPTPAGKVLGGGNVTGSSSKPITGNETDTFDLRKGGAEGGSAALHGSGNGPIFEGSQSLTLEGEVGGATHTVKKGDTLWGICDTYFQNPYQWPRIWSYNPQIQNPHWIEVGDQVRLKPTRLADTAGSETPDLGTGAMSNISGRFVDARRRVPPQTVFLREEGFVEDEDLDIWGEITGSPLEKTFLSDTDEVYIRIAPGKQVTVGQELTIYRPVRRAGDKGKVVAIQGTLRVNQVNQRDHLARATVIETLDVVERGARLGTIPRRFEVVPPVRTTVDLEAHVLAAVRSHAFQSQFNIIYLDKGSEDGLIPGNTLRFIRKGDAMRKSLPPGAPARRIDSESEDVAHVEAIPAPRDEHVFPEEIIGEVRVLTTKPHSSMVLVTTSSREIEYADVALARKGL